MNSKEIRVRIFNSEYNLQGEETEKVERIANYVDNVMNRINSESPNQSEETIAVVSALNIAEDFFKEKDNSVLSEEEYLETLTDCRMQIDDAAALLDENL
ncbi:hypothetical protein BH10BAC5_BH10BAC5_28230 [soil metagenome]